LRQRHFHLAAGLNAVKAEAVKAARALKDAGGRLKLRLRVLRMRRAASVMNRRLLLYPFLQDGDHVLDARTTRTGPGIIRSTGQKVIPRIHTT